MQLENLGWDAMLAHSCCSTLFLKNSFQRSHSRHSPRSIHPHCDTRMCHKVACLGYKVANYSTFWGISNLAGVDISWLRAYIVVERLSNICLTPNLTNFYISYGWTWLPNYISNFSSKLRLLRLRPKALPNPSTILFFYTLVYLLPLSCSCLIFSLMHTLYGVFDDEPSSSVALWLSCVLALAWSDRRFLRVTAFLVSTWRSQHTFYIVWFLICQLILDWFGGTNLHVALDCIL